MVNSEYLSGWEYISPKEVAELFTSGPRPRYGDRWLIRNEIKPTDLFCYLGARFGPPNGIQNFLRTDDSDNLIHWEWTLRTPEGFVDILGLNFRTEILLGSETTLSERDKEELVRLIKEDFSNYGPGMTKVRRMLEPWVEFVNPYQRLRRAIEQLLEQLDALELEPGHGLEQAAMRELRPEGQQERWKAIAAQYSQATGLCFGIRSMLPVMAEAFINMLLYLLMKDQLRQDERLRDNAIRQPIDVRVKSLSITCEGFQTPVDFTAEPCKRYNSLVNERNDLLHGNVVLSKLEFNDVYFWGKVPIFKQYRSMWERTIGVEVEAVGLDKVREEREIVEDFTEYVLSCLETDIRETVEFMLEQRDLGYRSDKGTVGVLFPNWLVDFEPGPPAGEVEAE